MEYKIIDGFRVSRYGTFLSKRCKWCYNLVRTDKGSEVYSTSGWCSEDCKQEHIDWLYLNSYFKTVEANNARMRRYWRSKHPIIQRNKSGMSRKEYLRKYFEEHRDRKREQAKLAARRYRIKISRLK